jgi:hypothetical protein
MRTCRRVYQTNTSLAVRVVWLGCMSPGRDGEAPANSHLPGLLSPVDHLMVRLSARISVVTPAILNKTLLAD